MTQARPSTGAKRPLKTLERVLSKAGLGSRTDARKWIGAGRVAVNGKVVQTPDHWVDLERDRVAFDGRPLQVSKRVYVLLYTPTGYITTYQDPEGRPTVYDLLTGFEEWVFPVGRLDLDTSALLQSAEDVPGEGRDQAHRGTARHAAQGRDAEGRPD